MSQSDYKGSQAKAIEPTLNLDETFIEEVFSQLCTLLQNINEWQLNPNDQAALQHIRRSLLELADCAAVVSMQPICILCGGASKVVQSILKSGSKPKHNFDETLLEICNVLPTLVSEFRDKAATSIDVHQLLHNLEIAGNYIAEAEDNTDLNEITEIFLEEGQEILARCSDYINSWAKDPTNFNDLPTLQRELHTFKGGARMADLSKMAELSHELESFYENLLSNNHYDLNATITLVQDAHDLLAQMIDATLQHLAQPSIATILRRFAAYKQGEYLTAEDINADQDEPTEELPTSSLATDSRREGRDFMRVQARDIDELVNLSGEAAVSRARLLNLNESASNTLSELRVTLGRLNDQIQVLEVEGDVTINFADESRKLIAGGAKFDTLEMDKYTSVQELARSVRETSTDLLDLHDSMLEDLRQMTQVLVQQKHIGADFHNLVMRARMVPFADIQPRLERIVRKVCTFLHKKVELKIYGGAGELDRTVLEHLIEPLEHLIRNAIDHGIETAELRKQAGKKEIGKIVIRLERDGNDILVDFSDDGAGINIAAVRGRAIKRGFLDPAAKVTTNDILRVIFQPGFTTANQLTQISGRGVGLDVVDTKIQQLNGEINVTTVEGKGTSFLLRVPAALSINNVIMLKVCGETYALPMSSVAGILHVDWKTLQDYYQQDNSAFVYHDNPYQLFYLGSLLALTSSPIPPNNGAFIPIILFKGKNAIALQADDLAGSCQIVIKSLSQKLRGLPNISGGTIGVDGKVVLVLDPLSLTRQAIAGDTLQAAVSEDQTTNPHENTQAQRILVVDDSITIRKVTTRLLQRNGYFVQTAKDGVDALEKLERFEPHLIILDIEMPRMDGFECARAIRNKPQFANTPIVMITSRTGEKHREVAASIGVNAYFGKPFKNHGLLEKIEALIHGR